MAQKKKEKQSFVMYNSFIDAASNLDDAHFRECIIKIRDYAIHGKDEKSENWGVNIVMEMAKPLLDTAKKRYKACVKNGNKGKEFGWLGGRPRQNKKPQTEPQTEPLNDNVKVNVNINDNLNVKEKVYVKEKDYLNEEVNDNGLQNNISTLNHNQVQDENNLQIEDSSISSPETKEKQISTSNISSLSLSNNENDGFWDAINEFEDF